MTVVEMIKALKRYDEDMVVEIRVYNPSVGPSIGTGIKFINKGIDGDMNRLLIYAEIRLVEVI